MALQKKKKKTNPNPGCSVAIKKGGKLQKGEVKWLQEENSLLLNLPWSKSMAVHSSKR